MAKQISIAVSALKESQQGSGIWIVVCCTPEVCRVSWYVFITVYCGAHANQIRVWSKPFVRSAASGRKFCKIHGKLFSGQLLHWHFKSIVQVWRLQITANKFSTSMLIEEIWNTVAALDPMVSVYNPELARKKGRCISERLIYSLLKLVHLCGNLHIKVSATQYWQMKMGLLWSGSLQKCLFYYFKVFWCVADLISVVYRYHSLMPVNMQIKNSAWRKLVMVENPL